MSLGAFARSSVLRGKDVPQAYTKWWKKVRPVTAEITQHLAPDEQQVIAPWVKTFSKKMADRFPTYLWPLSTMAVVYGVVTFTDSVDQAEDYAHRF